MWCDECLITGTCETSLKVAEMMAGGKSQGLCVYQISWKLCLTQR
jgi:hypothetical protein